MRAKAIERLKPDFPNLYAYICEKDDEGCLIPLDKNKRPTITFSGNDPLPKLPANCEAYAVEAMRAGLNFVDLDRNHKDGADGVQTWKDLAKAEGQSATTTYWQTTPSDGIHLWSLAPRGRGIRSRNNLASIGLAGIDIKAGGDNGDKRAFVLGPGSRVFKKVKGKATAVYGDYLPHSDVVPTDDCPLWFFDIVEARFLKREEQKQQEQLASYQSAGTPVGSLTKYKEKLLTKACDEMRTATSQREPLLVKKAYSLGIAGVPKEATVAQLFDAATIAFGGKPDQSLQGKIARKWDAGFAGYNPSMDPDWEVNPHLKPQIAVASTPVLNSATVTATSGSSTLAPAATETDWRSYYDDESLLARFLELNEDFIFVEDEERWLAYDNELGIWVKANEKRVRGVIREAFLLAEHDEAAKDGKPARVAAAKVLRQEGTSRRITSLLATASTRTVRGAQLNTHKDLVVVANGVVDLRTGELTPFDRALLFTRHIPVAFKPGHTNKWTDIALSALPTDSIPMLQVMAGQALTGHQPSSSRIFFFGGAGSNGKSTIVDLMKVTAGTYGGKPPKKVLLKGNESNFHTIHFKGLRQAIIEELPDEKFLDGGVVRDLAGTEEMTGEHKGKDSEEFEVQATIFITFNDRPQVTETAHGVWRRLAHIPFPYTYVESEADRLKSPDTYRLQQAMMKDLHKKSPEAVEAFLAWRIEGARLWYAEGAKSGASSGGRDPQLAPSVLEATKQWKLANDVIAYWFSENIAVTPGAFCLVDDLLDDFNQWRNSPKTTWGKANFTDKFTKHQVFTEEGLAFRQAARHSGLSQSKWSKEGGRDWDLPRIAKTQATFVEGISFRSDPTGVERLPSCSASTCDNELGSNCLTVSIKGSDFYFCTRECLVEWLAVSYESENVPTTANESDDSFDLDFDNELFEDFDEEVTF